MYQIKPLKKAYEIDLEKLDEGYLSDIIMCYAETANEAKSKLLKQIFYDDWKLKYSGDEVTYLNIPVRRRKVSDLYEFEGKELTKFGIDEIHQKRKRLTELDSILSDSNISHCYIRKGSYYRPNSCGYTDMKHRAGVYTKQEAVDEAKFCQDITIIPIDIIEHNAMINEEINDLKTRLLCTK